MKLDDVIIHAINYEKDLLDTINPDVLDICDEIHLMPDTHIGESVPIGFVGRVQPNKIIPEMVGVDIGCGMTAIKISKDIELDLDRMQDVIKKHIPTSHHIRDEMIEINFDFLDKLSMPTSNNKLKRFKKSLGTLGGGNHFIELNEFDDHYLLVVHSGSRNLGATICDYYTKTYLSSIFNEKAYKLAVEYIKETFDKSEWQDNIINLDKKDFIINSKYLTGNLYDNYINDMNIAIDFASRNRKFILLDILDYCHIRQYTLSNFIDVPHNYYDLDTNMLYKGAIDASIGKNVIIPINMRDGVIMGRGKGNSEWLCAGPHGAGRIKSRTQAKKDLTVDDMQNQMKDIYSKTININTLDEHPDAYRSIDEILEVLNQAVSNIEVGKVIFNFKGE